MGSSQPGNPQSKIVIEKPENEKKINIEIKDEEIQNHLSKETRDIYFNKLMQYENNLLKEKVFGEKKNNKEYNHVLAGGDLPFDLQDIGIDSDYNNEDNLIKRIIEYEDTYKVMEKKIIDEILKIKNDKKEHKIKHLTILLVGKNKIGKTTLVEYIFGLEEGNQNEHIIEKHQNFVIHYKEDFPLKIIEFKGIGYDHNNKIDTIGKEAFNCIKEQKAKNRDYNEYVHCIWYLISGERFNDVEYDFLKYLRTVYKDLTIPIILVYNLISVESSQKMKAYLIENEYFADKNYVEVSPVDNRIIGTNRIKPSFGGENLIKETLLKCSQSLEGDMIALMTNIILKSVYKNMLEINKGIQNDINKSIDYEINNFKTVLSDEKLKNYVVNLFENSIYHFYKGYNNNLSNIFSKRIIFLFLNY